MMVTTIIITTITTIFTGLAFTGLKARVHGLPAIFGGVVGSWGNR